MAGRLWSWGAAGAAGAVGTLLEDAMLLRASETLSRSSPSRRARSSSYCRCRASRGSRIWPSHSRSMRVCSSKILVSSVLLRALSARSVVRAWCSLLTVSCSVDTVLLSVSLAGRRLELTWWKPASERVMDDSLWYWRLWGGTALLGPMLGGLLSNSLDGGRGWP